GGIVGRLFREFSVTLAFAIAISTVVSLSVTPMICAHWVRAPPSRDATLLDRLMERLLRRMTAFYAVTLGWGVRHRWVMLAALAGTLAPTIWLYITHNKG